MSRVAAGPLSEKQFMGMVVQLARLRGWLVYHAHDARRSAPGFPDLILLRVHRDGTGKVLVWELKIGKSRLTEAQSRWLAAFRAAGVPACVMRPEQWPLIEKALE